MDAQQAGGRPFTSAKATIAQINLSLSTNGEGLPCSALIKQHTGQQVKVLMTRDWGDGAGHNTRENGTTH